MYRILLCPTKLQLIYAYVYIRTTLNLSLFGKVTCEVRSTNQPSILLYLSNKCRICVNSYVSYTVARLAVSWN